jgi:putative transposase
VESERYLLTCMRYIELNPVRAGVVVSPFDYRWSSIHANAGLGRDKLVTPHVEYLRLGSSDTERTEQYRAILKQGLSIADLETIRKSVNRDCALGSPAFQNAVARVRRRSPDVGSRDIPDGRDSPSA